MIKIYMVCLVISASLFNIASADSLDDNIKQLSQTFRYSYQNALENQRESFLQNPIITQDLLSMTLHLPSGAYRFRMNAHVYHLVAEAAHIPLTIHNFASQNNWRFTQEMELKLRHLKGILSQVRLNLLGLESSNSYKMPFIHLIDNTCQFIEESINAQIINENLFSSYYNSLKEDIDALLLAGAQTQIEQFHHQLMQWQQDFPNERWSALQIAILGTHGPRDGYVLKQYFSKLLQEPDFENKVVYVEFPEARDIYHNKTKAAAIAIQALLSNHYQKRLSTHIANDPSYLQHDVMASGGKLILDTMFRDATKSD